MKRTIFITLFIFITLIDNAQNQAWTIASSNISFTIKNAGFTVDGKFSGLTGTIQFDPGKTSGNKIEASIDANTINTNNSTRDGHLKKEEYFSVDKYPKINMSANSFTKEADGKFKGLFTLTLKGISKIVPLSFNFVEKDGKVKLSSGFKINRLDYKVGSSSFILSDEVNISIEVNCLKK
jgi:polyisoprenoid-binding protein YceI